MLKDQLGNAVDGLGDLSRISKQDREKEQEKERRLKALTSIRQQMWKTDLDHRR